MQRFNCDAVRLNRDAAFGERDAVFNRDAARHVAAREWRNGMSWKWGLLPRFGEGRSW